MQVFIVVLLVAAAAFFMGKKIYKQYKVGTGCNSVGCNACSTASKEEIEIPGHLKR